MRRANAIGVLFVIFVAGCAKPSGDPALQFPEILNGEWGWTVTEPTCAVNPHTLEFLEESQTLVERYSKPVADYRGVEILEARYDVLSMDLEKGSITLRLHGETRRTEDGRIKIWRMQFVPLGGRVGYVWEDPDDPGKRWGPIVKCPA